MLDALDADAVRRWSRSAVHGLAEHRAVIDALNVFPVPDGDTGRNMLHTFRAADAELRAGGEAESGPGPAATAVAAVAALAALARGAAHGAIGNSGFLLSQILRGLAEASAGRGTCDGAAVAAGLAAGADLARQAVVTPVEGTMLTVARAAADAAADVDPSGDADVPSLPLVAIAAVVAADDAVARTPQQLVDLAEAGVVDAGGRGLLIVLAALAETVTGTAPVLSAVDVPVRREGSPTAAAGPMSFEVQYLLVAREQAVERLRTVLHELGDSVAVVGAGRDTWKVHVHTSDVGAAIEAGVEAGRPSRIAVVRLDVPASGAAEQADRRIVAVVPGSGLGALFEREGVAVVDSDEDGTARTGGTVAGITAAVAGHDGELVLLADASARAAAETAAAELRGRGLQVAVIPVRSPVQGMSAIAVRDSSRRLDDDVVAMAEAAAATRFAEITVAGAAALTAVGMCRPGDVLGLIDGDVVSIGAELDDVAGDVLDRLLGIGAELVTLVVGSSAPDGLGSRLEARIRAASPLTDVALYRAGRTAHPVLIGAE